MTSPIDLPYLNYISEIIEDIEKSMSNISEEKFLNEKDIREANVRRLEIISGAVKNLSINLRKEYKDFDWEKVAIIKDKIGNQYFGMDYNLIWEIIRIDIPILKDQILKIKKDLERNN